MTIKFFNGLPVPGIEDNQGGGGQKFWFNGLPARVLTPAFTPPTTPPSKKTAPGQDKKVDAYIARLQLHRLRREVRREENRAVAFIPAEYLSPGSKSTIRGIGGIDWRERVKIISISPSGHTVRTGDD